MWVGPLSYKQEHVACNGASRGATDIICCVPCTLSFANLDFAILRAGNQQLRVFAEAQGQHSLIMHHELLICLVLQILL